MEKDKKIVIKLDKLPPRAEKLSLEELSDIFGGCGTFGDSCDKASDCCGIVGMVKCSGGSCRPSNLSLN